MLDPAQNHTFRDHYLEVDLDLSDVLFIATANVVDTIPGRCSTGWRSSALDGYTEDEKVEIARRYLLKRQLAATGVTAAQCEITEDAIRSMIRDYTREAGVRSLERELGRLVRKVAAKVATGTETPIVPVDADDELADWLGRPKVDDESPSARRCPAWPPASPSPASAATCCSSRPAMPGGQPGLTLTGQLGDVMKESAQIALSFVRSRADRARGRRRQLLRPRRPPRPRASRRDTQGRPVGRHHDDDGPRLAAEREADQTHDRHDRRDHAAGPGDAHRRRQAEGARRPPGLGLTEVVLPKRNGPDLDDVPENVREEMTFHLAATYDDVLAAAFDPLPLTRATSMDRRMAM